MKLGLVAAMAASLALQCMPQAGATPRIMSGAQADERVHELTSEISWHHSLSEAEALARQQNKMVFWVQMLGDISGAT